MQEVEAICDRAVIIHMGKIVADDSTANLSRRATGNDIIKIEFSDTVEAESIKKIVGVQTVKHLGGYSWKIEASPEKDIREDIFNFAVAHQISVLSLSREQQSLEEVFQSLTKTNEPKE